MAVLIEGFTPSELIDLPDEEFNALILTGAPVTFRAGSAEVLGQFEVNQDTLRVELAHIEGGRDGVLPTIACIASEYSKRKGLRRVEWIVYATNCAKPNLKLRKILERRGFKVRAIEGKGFCYHRVVDVSGGD